MKQSAIVFASVARWLETHTSGVAAHWAANFRLPANRELVPVPVRRADVAPVTRTFRSR